MKSTIKNPRIEGEEYPEYQPEQGEMGRREIEIEIEGRKFLVIASVPFGFFKIKFAAGGLVPEELAGSFTTVHDAERAIKVYVGKLNSQ